MIEAPQSGEARTSATEAPPNGPSKASMMIAAYRAARLNQRLTSRAAPLPQQDHIPSAELPPPAPVHDMADGSSLDTSFAMSPVQETEGSDQIAPPASAPVAGDPNWLAPAEAMTAPGPASQEVVALPHPETVIAVAEPVTSAPSKPRITLAEPAPEPSPVRGEPALAEIGLGPCMLLRLNQIGFKSIHDVAQTKPDDLRAALGSSSRLLDVEAWITSARHLTATGCTAWYRPGLASDR
jgi:hypothetical protein